VSIKRKRGRKETDDCRGKIICEGGGRPRLECSGSPYQTQGPIFVEISHIFYIGSKK
jgi:hypothetical protein